ncbi:hypothetical protein AnigIFM63309_001682 [Aspergillus niger]|nr:hypothetical protein AnigIFM49718_004800 [Aspergillus niger]GLA36024.1 hypothetical protein AnigIFM63309_001682 [Aspergillus niger]
MCDLHVSATRSTHLLPSGHVSGGCACSNSESCLSKGSWPRNRANVDRPSINPTIRKGKQVWKCVGCRKSFSEVLSRISTLARLENLEMKAQLKDSTAEHHPGLQKGEDMEAGQTKYVSKKDTHCPKSKNAHLSWKLEYQEQSGRHEKGEA